MSKKKNNKFLNNLKYPHGMWIVLFCIFFCILCAGTIIVTIEFKEQTIWHYVLYGISLIAFAYFVYIIVYIFPSQKNKIVTFLKSHKLTKKFFENYDDRTMLFSGLSFLCNIAYLVFLIVITAMSFSFWYFSLAIFYFLLSLTKAIVIYANYKRPKKETTSFLSTGIVMIFLAIAFSGCIVLTYTTSKTFEYSGIMIYAVALYTFVNYTLAIINFAKARKQENLRVQALRNLNFAKALTSVVVLQEAMFQEFSPDLNTGLANAVTGTIVCTIIIAMGVAMIVKSKKTKNATIELIQDKDDKKTGINGKDKTKLD